MHGNYIIFFCATLRLSGTIRTHFSLVHCACICPPPHSWSRWGVGDKRKEDGGGVDKGMRVARKAAKSKKGLVRTNLYRSLGVIHTIQ